MLSDAAPHLPDDAIESGMQTLGATDVMFGACRFPEGDEPVIGTVAP